VKTLGWTVLALVFVDELLAIALLVVSASINGLAELPAIRALQVSGG
jgi:hypothetical protein